MRCVSCEWEWPGRFVGAADKLRIRRGEYICPPAGFRARNVGHRGGAREEDAKVMWGTPRRPPPRLIRPRPAPACSGSCLPPSTTYNAQLCLLLPSRSSSPPSHPSPRSGSAKVRIFRADYLRRNRSRLAEYVLRVLQVKKAQFTSYDLASDEDAKKLWRRKAPLG